MAAGRDRHPEPSLISSYGRWILLTAALLLGVSSLAIIELHGFPSRFPGDVASVAAFYEYGAGKPFREGQCFITSKERATDYDRGACLRLDPRRRNVLLLGDSQAADLWTALRDTWPGTNFLQATASGCKPLLATRGPTRCSALMAEMLLAFLPNHRLDGVVLSSLWEPGDLEALNATIAYLKPLTGRITIFGPNVRYFRPVATTLARDMLRGDPAAIAEYQQPGMPELDARMRADIGNQASYVSIYSVMCPRGFCRLFAAPQVPMQFDYNHFTAEGAALVMGAVRASGIPAP